MELSRQQRRQRERAGYSAWERKRKRRTPWTGHYLGADDLLPYFADSQTADVVREGVDTCLHRLLGSSPIPEKGLAIGVRIGYSFGETRMTFAPAGPRQCSPTQLSHIAILGFLDDGDEGAAEFVDAIKTDQQKAFTAFLNAPRTELRLPFGLVRDPDLIRKPFGNSWLYNIRFNTDQAVRDGTLAKESFDVLGRGYIGVTRRPFVMRMTEHLADMKSGGGHLLHSVWRDLSKREIPHRVIAQLVAHSTNEDDVYEMEEKAVAEYTLAPRGLNMIPGGRSGIAHLKRLGFHTAGFENRDRLLAEAIAQRQAAKVHYRTAHLREYKPGAFTMVSGHWVNANELRSEPAPEAAENSG